MGIWFLRGFKLTLGPYFRKKRTKLQIQIKGKLFKGSSVNGLEAWASDTVRWSPGLGSAEHGGH
jgi:hypothetical protein